MSTRVFSEKEQKYVWDKQGLLIDLLINIHHFYLMDKWDDAPKVEYLAGECLGSIMGFEKCFNFKPIQLTNECVALYENFLSYNLDERFRYLFCALGRLAGYIEDENPKLDAIQIELEQIKNCIIVIVASRCLPYYYTSISKLCHKTEEAIASATTGLDEMDEEFEDNENPYNPLLAKLNQKEWENDVSET